MIKRYKLLDTMTAYQMTQLTKDISIERYGHINQFRVPEFEPHIDDEGKGMYVIADVPKDVLTKWGCYLKEM